MKTKDNSHEDILLMFQQAGVTDHLIGDGSKDKVLGSFKKKCSESGCRLKQTEPYSMWQKSAEGMIRELKRGAGMKTTKSRIIKKLSDHCLELEGIICSHTAHAIFNLEGKVLKTIITRDTANISIIEDKGWYEFYDPVGKQVPEEKMYLGQYLGPVIDVGLDQTVNILKSNGDMVHRSTYSSIIPEEFNAENELRHKFHAIIEEKIYPKAVANDFGEMCLAETLPFDKYEDDSVDGTLDKPLEELEPKPDLSKYVELNAPIVFP